MLSEDLKVSKEGIQKALEVVRGISNDSIPLTEIRDIDMRIQMANNILIQNEKKIWLRSKDGREILSEVRSTVDGLLREIMELQNSPERERWSSFIRTLEKLETVLMKMEEESRRRSMVVT